MLYLLNK